MNLCPKNVYYAKFFDDPFLDVSWKFFKLMFPSGRKVDIKHDLFIQTQVLS